MPEEAKGWRRNVVIVGEKPTMNYVVACLTLFNNGAPKIRIRARGRHISKVVDTVEMMRRVFLKDIAIDDISLGTEILTNQTGRKVSVSTIEIHLTKPVAAPT
ncbi:MAG: DNA-binding protein Alba [Candidatus Bathyarchaeia archaeon]